MDDFEISVDHELFRISERYQPDGRLSYDFSWLNGPADGTYGFTIGLVGCEAAPNDPDGASRMSREALVEEARSFLDSFYAAGGAGEEDFPDHIPARMHETVAGNFSNGCAFLDGRNSDHNPDEECSAGA